MRCPECNRLLAAGTVVCDKCGHEMVNEMEVKPVIDARSGFLSDAPNLGVLGFVLTLSPIVIGMIEPISGFSAVFGIAGFIISILGIKQAKSKGLGIAGTVIGGIGTLMFILAMVGIIALGSLFGNLTIDGELDEQKVSDLMNEIVIENDEGDDVGGGLRFTPSDGATVTTDEDGTVHYTITWEDVIDGGDK